MSGKILFGIDKLKEIAGSNYMLVCDSSFPYLSIKDSFNTAVRFDGFTPNPLYEQVVTGIELFKSKKCEKIVAVGGGSTIDVAKCIKLFCNMDPNINYLSQEKKESLIPLIAVPTTAGTGSESTRHAVIYYNGEKQSVSHPSIVPDYAILEPKVLETLPLYQKKCTMLDALCQGIESWWSVNSTPESIEYAMLAVDKIVANQKEYIENNSATAAAEIMLAANYSGRAINITATTAPHAMSYKLTKEYNIPHGHAVAVCLPLVWEYMLSHINDCIDPRGSGYLLNVLSEIDKHISLSQFCKLLNSLEIAPPLFVGDDSIYDMLAASVNPLRLKNNPVKLDYDILRSMYMRIVK